MKDLHKDDRFALPNLTQGALVAGCRELRKSSKKRKKKSAKIENDRNISNDCRYVEPGRKEYVKLTTKLPALVNPGRVDPRHTGTASGHTLSKLPQLHNNSKNRNIDPLRHIPMYEEQSSDSSSLFSAQHYENQQGLKRYRDSAHVARDHLVSLMPPINAKRYAFSKGMITGAKQELNRLKKLMGRDNVSSEQSHFESVMSEQRRRAASINAFMSGNTENKTNNSRPRFCSRTSGNRHDPALSHVSGSKCQDEMEVKTHKSRESRGNAMKLSSVLTSSKMDKSKAVAALQNALCLTKIGVGKWHFGEPSDKSRKSKIKPL